MLSNLINSWTLGAVAALGVIVVGRKKTWGWLVLVAAQVIGTAYGVMTREYGFVASGLGFTMLNIHNFRKWRRADRVAEAERALSRSRQPALLLVGSDTEGPGGCSNLAPTFSKSLEQLR